MRKWNVCHKKIGQLPDREDVIELAPVDPCIKFTCQNQLPFLGTLVHLLHSSFLVFTVFGFYFASAFATKEPPALRCRNTFPSCQVYFYSDSNNRKQELSHIVTALQHRYLTWSIAKATTPSSRLQNSSSNHFR